ncbi:SH3 domain-containing protein [Motilimonas eburnea]|uniref:SH3 domain-containing protein n=1 Tax=Motilimonas eburnea TaxID=1737488 RepID=UPI001E3E5E70|nr:SH3 domain-containing protein [Motilimonas eburnea]
MKSFNQTIIATIIGTTFLTGCASNKQEVGTLLGAATGVLVGSAFGSGSGKVAAMIIGGVAGSLIGNYIGASLDEQDRQAMARHSAQAMNELEDGQPTVWKSETSNASAVITPVATTQKTKTMKVVKLKQVEVLPVKTMISQPYQTKSSLNVRPTPSTEHQAVGGLKQGEVVTAVGAVENGWIMVAKNSITLGYVHPDFIQPYVPGNHINEQEREVAAQQSMRTAIDLDAIDTQQTSAQLSQDTGFDLDSIELTEDELVATTECRTMEAKVTSDKGQQSTETFNACKAADGAWELG